MTCQDGTRSGFAWNAIRNSSGSGSAEEPEDLDLVFERLKADLSLMHSFSRVPQCTHLAHSVAALLATLQRAFKRPPAKTTVIASQHSQWDFLVGFHDSYKKEFNWLTQVITGPVKAMDVRVRLFGVLRSAAKTSEMSLHVSDGTPTVRAVISQIVSTESFAALKQLLLDSETSDPRPNALIMVSGREIGTLNGLETQLTEDDELSLLPVAHGG